MRSLVFIAAILFVVGNATCQTPPKLPLQFYTNFTLVAPRYVPTDSPVFVSGFFALDYKNSGAFLDVGGEEFIPLTFHTSLVASPSQNPSFVNAYMYEGPLCWNLGTVPAAYFILFPFQIPANATYVGNKVVAGQACTGWEFQYTAFFQIAPVTIWVSKRTNTIVQIEVDNLEYLGDVQLNFFNTVTGPFSPSIYAPPNKANPNLVCNPLGQTATSLFARFLGN